MGTFRAGDPSGFAMPIECPAGASWSGNEGSEGTVANVEPVSFAAATLARIDESAGSLFSYGF